MGKKKILLILFINILVMIIRAEESNMQRYEYWIDNNYANRTTIADTTSDVKLAIDCSKLSSGVHNFYFRGQNSEGIYGQLYQSVFFLYSHNQENIGISQYEYWIDDYSSYRQMNFNGGDLSLSLPIDSLSVGIHRFYMRSKGANGIWGNLYQSLFAKLNAHEPKPTKIIGYKYSIGNQETYVDINPRSQFQLSNFRIDIPSLSSVGDFSIGDKRYSFGNDSVVINWEGIIGFNIQFKDDLGGYSNPLYSDISKSEILQKAYIMLNHQSALSLESISLGDCYVVKYNASERGNYYLRSTSPCNIDWFASDGDIQCRIDKADFGDSYSINLGFNQGTYYGVVYNLTENTNLRLLSNENIVENPKITFKDGQIEISCSDDKADIYYTLDGENPTINSKKYDSPIFVNENCTIKAIAIRAGYDDSDIVSFEFDADSVRCPVPQILCQDNTLVVTCDMDDVVMYYTLDGTIPDKSSLIYDTPIEFSHNLVLNVYATKNGWLDSEVGTYIVDSYKVANPLMSYQNGLLSLSASDENTTIYYTDNGDLPTEASNKYVSPISIVDNRPIKAIGVRAGYKNSDIVEFSTSEFKCSSPNLLYDGRYLTVTPTTEYSEIHYTMDGSTPTIESPKIDGKLDVGGIFTIKVIETRQYYNDSDEVDYEVKCYFDGKVAQIIEPGLLLESLKWIEHSDVENIVVTGCINAEDIETLSALSNLMYLNLENADLEECVLSKGALSNKNLISIYLPKNVSSFGQGVFEGCDNLASIVWKGNAIIPSETLNGINNPNLLLYVNLSSYAPSSVKNVIVSGSANSITLVDSEGNNNFYCPEEFMAKSITYTHNYSQKTVVGKTSGWETISLPFSVENITHSINGKIAPFAANEDDAKPFWLYSLDEYGFVEADKIEANKPYIISMPNSDEYSDAYILAGNVTFSSSNIEVPRTSVCSSQKNEFEFIPTTLSVEQGPMVYAMNVGQTYENFYPGATFVRDYSNINPFEAYLTTTMTSSIPKYMSLSNLGIDDSSFVDKIEIEEKSLQIYGGIGEIKIITERPIKIQIFTSTGMMVRNEDLLDGTSILDGFVAGIYFVNGNKVIVR